MNSSTVEKRQERAHLRHEVSLRVLQVFAMVAMGALAFALVAQLCYAQDHMLRGEQPSLSPVTSWTLAGAIGGGVLCALWCALTWVQRARA
ncbi:hypothetical protein ACWEBH_09395 [Micrococcus endophyticus]